MICCCAIFISTKLKHLSHTHTLCCSLRVICKLILFIAQCFFKRFITLPSSIDGSSRWVVSSQLDFEELFWGYSRRWSGNRFTFHLPLDFYSLSMALFQMHQVMIMVPSPTVTRKSDQMKHFISTSSHLSCSASFATSSLVNLLASLSLLTIAWNIAAQI